MIFEHDIHVPHRDGLWLSGNVYRPDDSDITPVPVITSLGPYNKEQHVSASDPFEARLLNRRGPTVVYERFEGEQWVKFGYAVVHLDTPGSGLSPGSIHVFSMRDLEYYYDAIEWLAKQPWCNGKIASCGLSYHSITSIGVATLAPPSLKAIIPWEVGPDVYRDLCYPGGIRNNLFIDWWWGIWVKDQQTGKSVRPAEDLAKNAVDFAQLTKDHPHYDEYWKANAPDFRNIKVPFYTVTNFSGHPVSTNSHFRLMHEAQTPKDKKWLELISGKHVKPMYDPENVLSQRRFLDHILKGVDNGWDKAPHIKYTIRGRYGFTSFLYDSQWPPKETKRTTLLLDATSKATPTSTYQTIATDGAAHLGLLPASTSTSLSTGKASFHNEADEFMFRPGFPYSEYLTNIRLESKRPGSSISFLTSLFEKPTLIAGQATVKLFVSLEKAKDTDLFLALRYLNKDDQEVTFDGILDSPNLPVTFGYQRLSKRKTDKTLSHDDFIYLDGTVEELVEEGQIVETTIMLGPVSVIVEKGGRLCLEVSSRSVEDSFCYIQCDPKDRKMGGVVAIHTGSTHPSEIMLPYQNVELPGLPEAI